MKFSTLALSASLLALALHRGVEAGLVDHHGKTATM